MNYVIVLILTLFGSIIVVGLIFGFLIWRGRKRSNITYTIYRTYQGSVKPIVRKGFIDVLNDGTSQALHKVFGKRGQPEIGRFSMKYVHTGEHGYMMNLEEFEYNRFRPIIFKRDKHSANIEPVPNEDIDFVIMQKERHRKMILEKQKNIGWWGRFGLAILFIIMAMASLVNSFYMYQTAEVMNKGVSKFNDGAAIKAAQEVFIEMVTNQTIIDAIKEAKTGEPNKP